MDKFVKDKVRVTCEKLKTLIEENVFEIPELKYIETDYKKAQEYPVVDDNWKPFVRNQRVSGKDGHFWFYTEIKTPSAEDNKEFVLEVITGSDGEWDAINPQGLLYLNGEIVQGIDLNHRRASLKPDTEYKVMLYFYVGMIDKHIEVMLNVNKIDLPVKDLYYDLQVPYEVLACYPPSDYTYIKTLKHLEQGCNRIDFRGGKTAEFYKSVDEARKYLKEEYFEKVCGNSDAIVSYVGHTHIDVAWLWTLDQTKEKVQRSFATVLSLMEKYPDYTFMSSQPQLYQYLKEEEPALYEKVKERIREGRWEAEGAMWLEADCNLSSGESLIRQILHGKRFFKEEFGVDSKLLWLPDVFGYSAALPQILKKSGVDKFVTSKISWSESNQLPYDTFIWEGIDGTEIFTYFMTAQNYIKDPNHPLANTTAYSAPVNPDVLKGAWERYQQKDFSNEAIVTFGYGDGGGGATAEMIETERRLEYGLPGMPKAKMSSVKTFLNDVEKNFKESCEIMGRIPRWVGELYLEFHRGTYTSMARNKKFNRQCEFLCQEAETLSVIDELLKGGNYPAEEFEKNWKVLLLNQFHDIIPGSSIKEVYDESDRQYAGVYEEVGAIKADKLKSIADNVSKSGMLVYNPNSFKASGYVACDDKLVYAKDIPAMGWKVVKEEELADVKVSDRKIESGHYSISFDADMNITSVYDKDNDREVIAEGALANQFCVYEDYPKDYDNWEITNYYKQKMWKINNVKSVESFSENGYGGFKIVRDYMNSTITQTIKVYSNSRRIDFENVIDWHEDHVLLKTHFPTTIHTNKANYEIQFGNVERPNHENTSWDAAKFEVCAQKWGDLSEEGYGVSLLNNCKYGYSAKGNEITLTLLKCGTFPNPEADQGIHEFTYSLYPHKDGFRQGGTINEAYLLNRPMTCISASGNGNLPEEFSLVSCDCENIVIETVKKAENGEGIIIRLYDAWGKKTNAEISLGFDAETIAVCDMMENPIEEIGKGNSAKVKFSNFEIVTLLVK